MLELFKKWKNLTNIYMKLSKDFFCRISAVSILSSSIVRIIEADIWFHSTATRIRQSSDILNEAL